MQIVSQWSNEIATQLTRKVVKFTGLKSLFVGGPKFLDYKLRGKCYQILPVEAGQAHFWALTGQTEAKPPKINVVAKSDTMRAFAPKLNYSFQNSGMQKFAFSLSLFSHFFALNSCLEFFSFSGHSPELGFILAGKSFHEKYRW